MEVGKIEQIAVAGHDGIGESDQCEGNDMVFVGIGDTTRGVATGMTLPIRAA